MIVRINSSVQHNNENCSVFSKENADDLTQAEKQVKKYLAYWFQLGKKVLIRNGEEALLPNPVLNGDNYSQEFEDCWLKIISPEAGECYLEGTVETVKELLTPEWEIISCCRCLMPVPLRQIGMPPLFCPCHDLPTWPNQELPAPRSPVNNQVCLTAIRQRLQKKSNND